MTICLSTLCKGMKSQGWGDNARGGKSRQRGPGGRAKDRGIERDTAEESRTRGRNWGDLCGWLATPQWLGHLGAEHKLWGT